MDYRDQRESFMDYRDQRDPSWITGTKENSSWITGEKKVNPSWITGTILYRLQGPMKIEEKNTRVHTVFQGVVGLW